jgi:hypothetical protein
MVTERNPHFTHFYLKIEMELHCQSRMLPALFRRCTAFSISSPCQQLVSLAAFRTHRLLSEPLGGSITAVSIDMLAPGSARRDIRTFSRKRNIFLDPTTGDENLKTLTVRITTYIYHPSEE